MYRFVLAFVFTVSTTFAQPATQPAIKPARGDTLIVSGIVHAPAAEIYAHFTTGEGYAKAVGVAKAKVDFRVGGQIRSAYQPDTDLDSDKAIINTILAYQPDRMITIKPTAPAGSPDWLKAICESGWNVLTFEPLGPTATRVTVAGMGFGKGELFDKAYGFFKQGNEATLEVMEKNLGHADAVNKDAEVLELFRACDGGEWLARESRPDGAILCGRTVWTNRFDGKFIEVHGELGDDKSMTDHAVMIAGMNPETKLPYFMQAMETGAIASGHLSMVGEKTVGGLWHFSTPQGPQDWFITMQFSEPDVYVQRMWLGAERKGEPKIVVTYRRKAGAAAGK